MGNPLLFGAVFDLGTPLLFDIGVYFVVWGIILMLVFSLGRKPNGLGLGYAYWSALWQ